MKILLGILKWAGIAVGVIIVLAGALAAHTWYGTPLKPNWFYDRAMLQYALDDPQMLTSLGFIEQFGIRGHNAHLSDGSDEKAQQLFVTLREDLETLHNYDREAMTGQDAISYDMFDGFVSMIIEGERWRLHTYPMNQMFGIQNGLPNFMATMHRVPDTKGAEHYISRLSQFERRLDQALDSVRIREAAGVIPPTFVVEKVLNEMRGFVEAPARENILFTKFDEHLAKLEESAEIMADERESFAQRAEDEITGTVYPAYGKLIAYYEDLLPRTTGNHGVWALPDGDEFYRFAARLMTTTDMDPDEIHRIGLAEVARIGAEMDAILVAQGFSDGSIGERLLALRADPAQLYEDSDDGRAQVITDYKAIIAEIEGGLDDYFDVRPKAALDVERVPEFREDGSALAYYQQPALDGTRPGVFYINLRTMADLPRFGMRTLAYHEGIPGHHFQIALAQELKGLPVFRRMAPMGAYIEGWALYSEQVAWEAGFQDDPLDNLGRLQGEMFRAVRLVVDTGMHAKRWTREQAIEYMTEHTGMGETEVIAEIERYLVIPGQALSYKVGMLKFLELRARAQTALGDRFDIREFHNTVLTNGALPLNLLERVVDDWIATKT
ncbi:MAG: DUF885 domain-containing protein [Gammaproteobacteria bacterium]